MIILSRGMIYHFPFMIGMNDRAYNSNARNKIDKDDAAAAVINEK